MHAENRTVLLRNDLHHPVGVTDDQRDRSRPNDAPT